VQIAVDGAKSEAPTDVVQINFQLFPLTEQETRDEGP